MTPRDKGLKPQDDLFVCVLEHTLQVAYAVIPLIAEPLSRNATEEEYEAYLSKLEYAFGGLGGLNVIFDDTTRLRSLHWYNQVKKKRRNGRERGDKMRCT